MKISELKRIILMHTDSKPFFLEFNISNEQPVSDLIDKHKSHYNSLQGISIKYLDEKERIQK